MAPASDDRSGIIITFYSYKGGTGRSMALANVGCLLGRRVERGKRCLLIDWDLEAPGLHRYFAETCDSLSARRKRGLVEYFDKLRDLLEEGPNFYRSLAQDRRRTLAKHHPLDDYIVRDVIDNVDLLKAGRVESSEYKRLVNQLNWSMLHDEYPIIFDAFQELLSEHWDFVLIDSRTGLTDVGGVCTALLPEKLVVVFTPNRQSLDGLRDVVSQAVEYRRHSDDFRPLGVCAAEETRHYISTLSAVYPQHTVVIMAQKNVLPRRLLAVFPLPSRVDLSEELLRRQWRDDYEKSLSELLSEVYKEENPKLGAYLDEVQIPQKSYYAYGEKIAVLEETRRESLSLSRAYEAFCDRLVGLDRAWEQVKDVAPTIETRDWRTILYWRVNALVVVSLFLSGVALVVLYSRFDNGALSNLDTLLAWGASGLLGAAMGGMILSARGFLRNTLTGTSFNAKIVQLFVGPMLAMTVGPLSVESPVFALWMVALGFLVGFFSDHTLTKLEAIFVTLFLERASPEAQSKAVTLAAAVALLGLLTIAVGFVVVGGTPFVIADDLMWTVEDSGVGYDDWNQAITYCSGLTLGGYTNWRLADIDDLEALYDPQVSYVPRDGSTSVHVKSPIRLTADQYWSFDLSSPGFAWLFNFSDGRRFSAQVNFAGFRALCRRRMS